MTITEIIEKAEYVLEHNIHKTDVTTGILMPDYLEGENYYQLIGYLEQYCASIDDSLLKEEIEKVTKHNDGSVHALKRLVGILKSHEVSK